MKTQILATVIAHLIASTPGLAEETFLTPNFEVVARSEGFFVLCVQRIPETRKALGEWEPIVTCKVASAGRIWWFLTHSKIQGEQVTVDMYVKHERNRFSAFHHTYQISQFIDDATQNASICMFKSSRDGGLLVKNLSRHQGWSSTSEIKGFFFDGVGEAKRFLDRPELGVENQLLPIGVIGTVESE